MKRILPLLSFLVWAVPLLAQQTQVSGRIVSGTDGSPLSGASISVKGTSSGTLTDADGAYTLTVADAANAVLLVRYVGFVPQEIRLGGRSSINVQLQEDAAQLSEVVVVGYVEQPRKTFTGAVASLNEATVRDLPAASIDQKLQGRLTGVQVAANSGVPGGGIFLRIRGTNSVNASNDPLYVVDGVFINNTNLVTTGLGNQVQSNAIADINPADIENIEILKDANATAIYGSRGANGVVIITTKRGRRNTKPRVQFDTYQGWSQTPKQYDVVTGPQLAELENELFVNDGGNPSLVPFRDRSVTGTPAAQGRPDEQPTYDRISDLFRTARVEDYQVSLSGGDNNTAYFISLGYFNQESIVKPSTFSRYSGRINLDQQVADNFRVGVSATVARTFRNVSSNDNNPAGVINSALFPRSNLPIRNANGSYARYGNFDNHLALIDELNNEAVGLRGIGSITLDWTILPGLSLRSSNSIDLNELYENNYNNTNLIAGAPRGNGASIFSREVTLLNEQVLTYRQIFGSHNVTALVGNTYQQRTLQRTNVSGQQFPSNYFQRIASSATQTGSSSETENRLASVFGKVIYSFRDKYLFDASVRGDASSRFGVDKRWGWFPAVGLGWRLDQESFVKDLGWFDELKLRAGIGLTGNQEGISDFASLGLWQGGANYLDLPGTRPVQLANPNLSWETTRQTNIGLDVAILNRRLALEFNWYDKYTDDLLLDVPVSRTLGYNSVVQNFGAVRNRGVELSLTGVLLERDGLRWTANLVLSRNVNKIERLASPFTVASRDIVRLEEGYPLYSFWLYRQLGVNPETGNAIYQDVNGDGQITVADRQIVGDAWPDWTGGFNTSVTWRSFDLTAFFYFETGAEIINMNRYFLVHGGVQRNIGYFPEQLDRWQRPGDVTDIPRLTATSDPNNPGFNNYGGTVQNLSTRYLEDGSFLRLRSITLGYTLPTALLESIGVDRLRIYATGTNLWTLTDYSGLDPEISSQSGIQNARNFDWATVPQPRTVTIGLNATF